MSLPPPPGHGRYASDPGLPGAPQPGQVPAQAPAPARGYQRHNRELVIWGAHGGAGTSTLAIWLQPAWDMGAMRPDPEPAFPGHSCPRSRAGHHLPQHRLVSRPRRPGRSPSLSSTAVTSMS